jgi:peptidyl-prolyl cis-trans isomerase C
MRRPPRTVLLAGVVLAALACRRMTSDAPARGSGPAVATWAGDAVTADEVRTELVKLPTFARADPVRRRAVLDGIVTNRLLFAEGRRRGYTDDPEIVRQVDALREHLVVQRLMRDLHTPPTVSDAEARRYYDEHVTLFSSTRVRASHILVADEATAQRVYAEAAANPERFPELARRYSTDQTSAKRGGDLGLFGPGRMVPAFERAAFALAVGEVSAPVHTRYGWHVIRVTERHEGSTQPFEAVKAQIVARLTNRKIEARVDAEIEKLRSAANVHVDEARLAAIEVPPGAPPAPHADGLPSH